MWNAKAEAVVSTAGTVTQIRYSNAGAGYTNTPATVSISSVTSNSFGDYVNSEIVKGVSTGTSDYVADWDAGNRILKVTIPNGDFAVGEVLVGAGASYRVLSKDSDFSNNEFASNVDIEFEADLLFDF